MKETKAVNQEAVFEKLPVPSALRVMVVPAVVSQLIVLIYNMADTFYVGQTGNPYMVAGTSLILPIFNITLCLAGLAGVGGGALISRLLGENKREEARRVSAFSLYLGICIAAVFSLGTGIFMRRCWSFWEPERILTGMPASTRSASSCWAAFLRCCPTYCRI